MIERALLFCLRVHRAWRYYRRLRYSWHLAWHKATCVYASLAR